MNHTTQYLHTYTIVTQNFLCSNLFYSTTNCTFVRIVHQLRTGVQYVGMPCRHIAAAPTSTVCSNTVALRKGSWQMSWRFSTFVDKSKFQLTGSFQNKVRISMTTLATWRQVIGNHCWYWLIANLQLKLPFAKIHKNDLFIHLASSPSPITISRVEGVTELDTFLKVKKQNTLGLKCLFNFG